MVERMRQLRPAWVSGIMSGAPLSSTFGDLPMRVVTDNVSLVVLVIAMIAAATFAVLRYRILTLRTPVRPILLLTALLIAALTALPPWTTILSGNAYPKIGWHWLLSPPAPLPATSGAFDYRVDIIRLQDRYTAALAGASGTLALLPCFMKRFVPSP